MTTRRIWIGLGLAKRASRSREPRDIWGLFAELRDIVVHLRLENKTTDGRGVGEDTDTENDDDSGRHGGSDAELLS